MSVQVAVRIRPFNKREKELNCQLVVQMNGKMTTLLPPKGSAQNKRDFTYDHSFWSFDQFQDVDGYLTPTSPAYSDQRKVFEVLGNQVLENAWQGYHCCLFAYGQTGSGKSYSMIGFGKNKGIVPTSCEELFKRAEKKAEGQEFEVNLSMLEIYNQKIQDLFVPIQKRPAGGLNIRESPVLGVYVEGASKKFVSNYQSIETLMDEGTKNRTIAATQMNATSSRAHTIISIEFKNRQTTAGKKTEKLSVINLVDLAGSQRQAKTQASGDRLKEAIGINTSLTTLGQVISALAQKAESKKDVFVPYRNSALTRILQNALGGNSKTIMICALSPASDNYDETLSTLRYADQAKKIQNKPIVNESETDKLIRTLKQENEKLRKMLAQKDAVTKNVPPQPQPNNEQKPVDKPADKPADKLPQKPEQKPADKPADKPAEKKPEEPPAQEQPKQRTKEQIQKEQKQIQERLKALETKTEEKKKQEAKAIQQILHPQKKENEEGNATIMGTLALANLMKESENQKDIVVPPFFENISKDLMMHRKLKIFIEKDIIHVGKKGANPPCDIIFGGRDMAPNHADIIKRDGKIYIKPLKSSNLLFRNGKKVTEEVELFHLDRVIFGWNSVFLFKNKDDKRTNQKIRSRDIDWDFVKDEMKDEVDIDQSDTEDGGSCCTMM